MYGTARPDHDKTHIGVRSTYVVIEKGNFLQDTLFGIISTLWRISANEMPSNEQAKTHRTSQHPLRPRSRTPAGLVILGRPRDRPPTFERLP